MLVHLSKITSLTQSITLLLAFLSELFFNNCSWFYSKSFEKKKQSLQTTFMSTWININELLVTAAFRILMSNWCYYYACFFSFLFLYMYIFIISTTWLSKSRKVALFVGYPGDIWKELKRSKLKRRFLNSACNMASGLTLSASSEVP